MIRRSQIPKDIVKQFSEVLGGRKDPLVLCNISNTWEGVSSEQRVENTMRSGVFLAEIRGVWKSDETHPRVFDIE